MWFYRVSHSRTSPLEQIRVKCLAQGLIDRFFTLLARVFKPTTFWLLAQTHTHTRTHIERHPRDGRTSGEAFPCCSDSNVLTDPRQGHTTVRLHTRRRELLADSEADIHQQFCTNTHPHMVSITRYPLLLLFSSPTQTIHTYRVY